MSFSNPIRQPPLEFEAWLEGNKADCAAARMKKRYPAIVRCIFFFIERYSTPKAIFTFRAQQDTPSTPMPPPHLSQKSNLTSRSSNCSLTTCHFSRESGWPQCLELRRRRRIDFPDHSTYYLSTKTPDRSQLCTRLRRFSCHAAHCPEKVCMSFPSSSRSSHLLTFSLSR